MNISIIGKILLFACVKYFLLTTITSVAGENAEIYLKNSEKYSVSLNPLKDAKFLKKERMVVFQVEMISGKIDSLKYAPIGWCIRIDNDPSWRTKIDGSCVVGATSLSPDEFNDILIIEKDDSIFKDQPFDINVEIIVTEDFDKTRTVNYKMKDLIFRKL